MGNKVRINPLKPYSRGVSIIGVGATPFRRTIDDPETNGLCDGELFGYAAIEAMKDAGIASADDVDFYVHAQAGSVGQSCSLTANMHVANWFGMKGKGSIHHSEACCTGYVALEQAVMYVASGAYDVVLSGTCDMSYSNAYPDKPAFMRRLCAPDLWEALCMITPRTTPCRAMRPSPRTPKGGLIAMSAKTASPPSRSTTCSAPWPRTPAAPRHSTPWVCPARRTMRWPRAWV